MAWPPDLADDLPAPRDDEPASLRQDIADELADHLTTAFQREQHRTADEAVAKAHVLDRFGDPRKIARKLWFDALSENIMSQRMTFVALLVVILASLGSTALMWHLIDQARVVNQAMLEQSREATAALLTQSQDSNRALMEHGQKANDALLTKLEALTSTGGKAEPAASMEWNSVMLRLFTGSKPGKPAVGYRVHLSGYLLDTAKEIGIDRRSDENGLVDLGLVRPGQHRYFVQSPWQQTRSSTPLTVRAGQSVIEDVECPVKPVDIDMDCSVEWPEELKSKEYYTVAHFVPEPQRANGTLWSTNTVENEIVVLIDAAGAVIPFPMSLSLIPPALQPRTANRPVWPFTSPGVGSVFSDKKVPAGLMLVMGPGRPWGTNNDGSITSIRPEQFGFVTPEIDSVQRIRCLQSTYRLMNILVTGGRVEYTPPPALFGNRGAKPTSDNGTEFETELPTVHLWPVLGGLIDGYGYELQQRAAWRGFRQQPRPSSPLLDWVEIPQGRDASGETETARREAQPKFIASPDQPNHWTITLPQRLVDIVLANPAVQAKADVTPGSDAPAKPE